MSARGQNGRPGASYAVAVLALSCYGSWANRRGGPFRRRAKMFRVRKFITSPIRSEESLVGGGSYAFMNPTGSLAAFYGSPGPRRGERPGRMPDAEVSGGFVPCGGE